MDNILKFYTLLTGNFNLRPPQPRYSSTCDVQIVLEFIKNNWTDNKSLTNKNLTLKLAMLSAASRASSIHHPDMCFKSLSKQKAVFNFSKLLKTWTNGSAPPKFEIFAFERDTDLLVIQTLKVYLNRSQESRDEKKIAFIRHKYPHKPIPVSDVSRWIKMLLLYQR